MHTAVRRIQGELQRGSIGAVILTSYANVYFASGATIRTIKSIPTRPALVLVPAHGDPVIVVSSVEAALVKSQSAIADIRPYVDSQESPAMVMADAAREKGVVTDRIGLETLHISLHWAEALQNELPRATFMSCDSILERLRAVKSDEELRIIGDVATLTQSAISQALDLRDPNDTELAIAWRIERFAREHGGTGMRFCYVGSGPNSGLIHPNPSSRHVSDDEVVRVDAAVYNGIYAADLAYTRLPTCPTTRQRDLALEVWNAKELVIEQVRPGVRVSHLYELCREQLARRGIELWMPHIGHGIGIDGGHDYPILEPSNDADIEEGMVLCIEPLCTSPEGEAFHFEDMIAVGVNNAVRLMQWSGSP